MVLRAMIVTSRPSLGTQTHLSYACDSSSFGFCGATTERVGVPVFEEPLGVGIHEASEPPDGVGGAVRAVVVVPTRYLALVLVTAYMRGGAKDRFVSGGTTEAALTVRGAVLSLVPRLQLEAFVTECWLSNGRLFIWVMEGDVVFVGRALSSSDGWHAAATGRGACGRLRINVVEYASGKSRVDETSTGLEQGVVVHSYVLFQGFETRVIRGTSCGLRTEPHDLCGDSRVVDGVDMFIHELFQVGMGVQ